MNLNSGRSGIRRHRVSRGSWWEKLQASNGLVEEGGVSEQYEQKAEWVHNLANDVHDEPHDEVTEPVGVLLLNHDHIFNFLLIYTNFFKIALRFALFESRSYCFNIY